RPGLFLKLGVGEATEEVDGVRRRQPGEELGVDALDDGDRPRSKPRPSVPAGAAKRTWLGCSPCSFSHHEQASRTNCTWVRSSGARAAATLRCQRSVACQSRNPGLS